MHSHLRVSTCRWVFMKANRDMEVTLARVGDSTVSSLFSFRVLTDKGLATGSAYHFAVE